MERKDLREIYAARPAEMQAISGDLPLQPALLDKMLTTIDAADARAGQAQLAQRRHPEPAGAPASWRSWAAGC